MIDCFKCEGKGFQRKLFLKITCKRCKGTGLIEKREIIGVCLGWDARPHICHEDGTYFPSDIERRRYPNHFVEGSDWPINPETKEKLPIAEYGGR